MQEHTPGPVAVLGATGNQGGQVAAALLRAGLPVRAVTRFPDSAASAALRRAGAEVAKADMAQVAALEQVFAGVAGVFSVQNFWELHRDGEVQLGLNVLEAARRTGAPHLVYSSGIGCAEATPVRAMDGKAQLETAVKTAGLPYTILRPALFMDDVLGASLPFRPWINRRLAPHRKMVGALFLAVLRSAFHSSQPIPLVAMEDVGRTALWAFSHPEASAGQAWELVGSRLTAGEVLAAWQAATGRRPWPVPIGPLLRVAHPEMAELVRWLARHEVPIAAAPPIPLATFSEWLARRATPPGK